MYSKIYSDLNILHSPVDQFILVEYRIYYK